MAWYLHIDMDSFYVSVERALDPSLNGKPVMVGGRSGRGVVTSASYEARRYGVRSAMPGFQARKLCPTGIFLPGRRKLYSEFSKKVFSLLRCYSPDVRAFSIDEGLVDLTGTERLLGHPFETAHTIIGRIMEDLKLPSSGGLSTSRTLAKIAATAAKPHGLVFVPSGSEESFLEPLPVSALPGVGPKTFEELHRQGITTVGILLRHARLRDRFLDLERHHSGSDTRRSDHSIGNETTLDQPLRDREKMETVLRQLVEEVAGRLRRQKLHARCITVKIRYTNFQTITRSRTLRTPTCFDGDIFKIATNLLARNVSANAAVRLLGVSVSGLEQTGWQESLFDYGERYTMEKLYEGIDRLRSKYGDDTITLGAKPDKRG